MVTNKREGLVIWVKDEGDQDTIEVKANEEDEDVIKIILPIIFDMSYGNY